MIVLTMEPGQRQGPFLELNSLDGFAMQADRVFLSQVLDFEPKPSTPTSRERLCFVVPVVSSIRRWWRRANTRHYLSENTRGRSWQIGLIRYMDSSGDLSRSQYADFKFLCMAPPTLFFAGRDSRFEAREDVADILIRIIEKPLALLIEEQRADLEGRIEKERCDIDALADLQTAIGKMGGEEETRYALPPSKQCVW